MMRQSYDYPQAMPTFILSSDLLIVNMIERSHPLNFPKQRYLQ
ncbi:MAG: hypothetical protein ACK5QA_00410 [Dolichospermum sp.]